MEKIINKIKKERWMEGVRTGDSILIYGLRCRGEKKYIEKQYGKKFIQWRMLVPKDGGNVRAIGLSQAKKFHDLSAKTIVNNPGLLIEKIKEDETLINNLIKKAKAAKNKNDLFKIAELFKKHSFLFFLCVSYGLKIFDNKKFVKNKKLTSLALKEHDRWRNSIFNKEAEVLNSISPLLKREAKKIGLKNYNDLFYLEADEFKAALKNKPKKNLKQEIEKRKKGFAYIFIEGKSRVITNPEILDKMKEIFSGKKESFIKGSVAFKNKNKIRGVVQVINNPKQKPKKGAIMVTLQTSPKLLHLVKNFSAIIADEGGITSHAAIISRELKIPCIVDAKNATKILKDGDRVEMDLNKGVVKILR